MDQMSKKHIFLVLLHLNEILTPWFSETAKMVIAKFVFKAFLWLLLTFQPENDSAVPAHSDISILDLWPMREKKSNCFVKEDVSCFRMPE